jgi:hypothetical protein
MPRPLITILMNLTVTAACLAKTAVGDWQSVQQDIPRGWQITVVTSFTFPCIFEQADDEELICRPLQRNREAPETDKIRLRRDRIREIRVERREGAKMLAGAADGGGLGAGLGRGARRGRKRAFGVHVRPRRRVSGSSVRPQPAYRAREGDLSAAKDRLSRRIQRGDRGYRANRTVIFAPDGTCEPARGD